jgi:glycosyltransferase involved in cell wall biosynthesis
MRILIVNYEYPPLGGGGGIETRDLAEELAKRHTVHVLTTWYRGLPREETRNGVVIHRVRVWGRTHLPTATLRSMVTFVPAALLCGASLLSRVRPQLLNAHFVIPSGIPAVFLAKLSRLPLVITLIGGDIYDPSKGVSPHRHAILRLTVSWVLRRADVLTAISRDTPVRAILYHGAPSTITVVPLGLVPPHPARRSREELGWDARRFHFITVGRLIPRKGYLDLLRGFAQMEEKETLLHVLGDGPLASDVQRECDRLGIADRVTLHGRVTDEEKFQYLAVSDAYVSASLHEGFGICFLEAMSVGLPIIATDTGGQTDFLVGGKNAILVPPRRPEQIAHALDWLVRDPHLRSSMGVSNRESVQQHMIDATGRRYEEIFQRLVRS